MLTPSSNKLTRNVIGAIIPCQRPIKKHAGVAPGSLYAEVDPAMERAFVFGIEGCKYKKGAPFDKIKKTVNAARGAPD